MTFSRRKKSTIIEGTLGKAFSDILLPNMASMCSR
jgi:hypothetical protein